MDDGPVTHGDVSANAHRLPRIPVKNSAVLDIAPKAPMQICSRSPRASCGPEAAARCHLHIANHDGGFRPRPQDRFEAQAKALMQSWPWLGSHQSLRRPE